MAGRRWTKKEDRSLLDGAGVFSIAWFRRKAGNSYRYPNAPKRSRMAVYRRAQRLLGRGGLTRGTYTLVQASRETSYDRSQILRAQHALNQKWKRLSPRGPFLITFDQLDEILGWLQQDYWCSKLRLYGCVNCGANGRPSRGRGQCPKCFWRIRRLTRRLGFPTATPVLSALVESCLDNAPLGMRASLQRASEHLGRGWALTEEQILTIASLLN